MKRIVDFFTSIVFGTGAAAAIICLSLFPVTAMVAPAVPHEIAAGIGIGGQSYNPTYNACAASQGKSCSGVGAPIGKCAIGSSYVYTDTTAPTFPYTCNDLGNWTNGQSSGGGGGTGTVKSVNGQSPDANGSVVLTPSAGGVLTTATAGAANGVATLDSNSLLIPSQLPTIPYNKVPQYGSINFPVYSVDLAGDSYDACWGAYTLGSCMYSLIMNDTPVKQYRAPYAVAGTLSGAIARSVFANHTDNPNYPQALISNGGNNDYNSDTCTKTADMTAANSNCLNNYAQIQNATWSYYAGSASNRILGSLATKTGTCSNDGSVSMLSLGNNPTGFATNCSTGATLTFSIPATNNGHIGITQVGVNGSAGAYTVTIGGVAQSSTCPSGTTTFTVAGCNGQALLVTQSPMRQEYFNAAWAGTTVQVVITVTTGPVIIQDVDYAPTTVSPNANIVWALNSGTGYDATGIYSAAAAVVISQLQADGYRVFPVDIRTALTNAPGSGISQTDIFPWHGSLIANHPGDAGQWAMYQALLAAEQTSGFIMSAPGMGAHTAFDSGALQTPLTAPSCYSFSAGGAQGGSLLTTGSCFPTLNNNSQLGINGLALYTASANGIMAGFYVGQSDTMPDGATSKNSIGAFGQTANWDYFTFRPQATTPTNAASWAGNSKASVRMSTGDFTTKGFIQTPQVIFSGTAPTIANGPAAGTSPGTPTITGANMDGRISITTGTATTASATLATITFGGTVATAPQGCSIQPVGANATGQVAMVSTTYPTTTGWTIAVAGSAVPASTTYTYSYQCF